MPLTVNIHEAKTHLSRLLKRVTGGEEIVIAKAGKPVALLVGFPRRASAPRIPGGDAGKVIISPDFDAPIEEFEAL